MEPAAGFLGLLPIPVAAYPHPIQAGRGVENGVRLLGEQPGETAGELLRLPPIPEGGYLEPVLARTRPARRRPHAEAPVHLVPFAVLGHQPGGRLTAGNLQTVQIRRESDPDLRRQHDRPGNRTRVGSRCRPDRGSQEADRGSQTRHRGPPFCLLSIAFSHAPLTYVIGNRRNGAARAFAKVAAQVEPAYRC